MAFLPAAILLPKAPSIRIPGFRVAEHQGRLPLHLSFLVPLAVSLVYKDSLDQFRKEKLVKIGAS